jgi:hypothetical protein
MPKESNQNLKEFVDGICKNELTDFRKAKSLIGLAPLSQDDKEIVESVALGQTRPHCLYSIFKINPKK